MKGTILTGLALATLMAMGCDSSTRPGGRGTLTAALASPNGDEGAAVLDVAGTVEAFNVPQDVMIFTTPVATGTRVVLVRMIPGRLSMTITVPDVSQRPVISVVEVADGEDRLRSSVSAYAVTFQ